MTLWSIIGLLLVGYVTYRFVKALGDSIPILELLLLIAGLQWVVGAFIEYRSSFQHYKYYMYVEEATYMEYVVPAYGAMVIIVFFWLRRINLKFLPVDSFHKYSNYGIIVVAIGFAADVLKLGAPGGLQFVFYLLANFKYVGAIMLFFSTKKMHRYIFYGTIVFLIFIALSSGFFHELILWGTFFFMFWAYKRKPTFRFNLMIIIVGFVISTMIQAVKSDYRVLIWQGYDGSYTSLFFEILNARLSGGLVEDTSEQGELNVRLNQGWIISAIMDNTPRIQAYAKGKTVKEAVFASALPRFLNPEKKTAGGVENFELYTGIELAQGTSMGMSLVGEGYANFGKFGGIIFMLVWGVVVGWIWLFLIKRIQSNIVILFFLPLIFFQVVKAETELVVVLNHVVKASILVFLVMWVTKRIFRIKFENG